MEWSEILTIITPMCALLGWIYGRIDKKFEKMDQKIDGIKTHFDNRLDTMQGQLNSIEAKVSDLNIRVSVTEMRLEERKPNYMVPAIPMQRRPGRPGRKPKQLPPTA